MRASILVPSVLAAAVLVAAGTIWADAASRRTVAGRPAAIGAIGSVTTATSTPSPTPDPSPSAPAKKTPTPSSTHASPGGAHPVQHQAVPYGPPVKRKTAAGGSCHPAYASGASSIEAAVFAMLNQQRAANGLCSITWSPLLQKSARGHSVLMDQKSSAADCSDGNYSHVYAGEPDINTRIYATGYPRVPIAEAIGCSPDTSTHGALTLQELMYNEKPPANQHREMILSTVIHHVGIAIVVDQSDGTLWLTEDFGA